MKTNVRVTKVQVDEKALEAAMSKILDSIADSIYEKGQQNISDFGIDYRGFLASSGSVDKANPLAKNVSWSAPYAEWLEYGHPSHPYEGTTTPEFRVSGMSTPPNPIKEQIKAWARDKLKIEDEGAITAIYNKITEEGIAPRRFVSNAIERTKAEHER